ncbi:MAG: LysM peptidoglycan-binding domain-containing protein [Phycisphaerae bacterium]|nr:LysM peptidoglycan-binding domain-containing protein [Phycisphaerae bacterium]
MSTDYKIGIVVGLVVLIAGIVYFLLSGEADQNQPPIEGIPNAAPNQVAESAEPADTASLDEDGPVEVPLESPAPDTQPVVTTPEVLTPTVAVPTTAPAEAGFELYDDADSAAATPPAEATEESETIRITEAPVEDANESNGFQLTEDAEEAFSQPDPEPVIRPIARADESTADLVKTGGTYVVKKGDNGFWIIAQRVYGPSNGKYWTLIQKANPAADTNALREGQMLKIPPLPAEATASRDIASAGTDDRSRFGEVTTGEGGNQVYVVAEGEAGLWGVAEKVYGKGQLWEHIQRANPSVKPSALRPGMKLVIPPLPTTRTRPGAISSTPQTPTRTTAPASGRRGEVFTENGRRYYVVQAGDKGYWGIAKKVYNDGKYSYLIDRANTGVDSYSLQPGDKLEVPPLSASSDGAAPLPRRAPTPPRRAARPAPSPPADGEPDFGP